MTDSHHRAGADSMGTAAMQAAQFVRLEFPAHDGGNVLCKIRRARMHQQAWRINLEILALDPKRPAVVSGTDFIPFAAGTKIGVRISDVEEAFLSPPLRALLEVGDGFEDANWRSCDEDLRQNCVGILSESCGCHFQLLTSLVSPFSAKACSHVKTSAQPKLWPLA